MRTPSIKIQSKTATYSIIVNRSCSLVHDKYARVAKKCTYQAEQLTLTDAEIFPSFLYLIICLIEIINSAFICSNTKFILLLQIPYVLKKQRACVLSSQSVASKIACVICFAAISVSIRSWRSCHVMNVYIIFVKQRPSVYDFN